MAKVSHEALVERVAKRFAAMQHFPRHLLFKQALLAASSERMTGHGVDWVLGPHDLLEHLLRQLVLAKPDCLRLQYGDVTFQFVIDVTMQRDAHLETGPFTVGKIIFDLFNVDVRARLIDKKQIGRRRLFIFAGELAP